jgi:hypothetical protein
VLPTLVAVAEAETVEVGSTVEAFLVAEAVVVDVVVPDASKVCQPTTEFTASLHVEPVAIYRREPSWTEVCSVEYTVRCT